MEVIGDGAEQKRGGDVAGRSLNMRMVGEGQQEPEMDKDAMRLTMNELRARETPGVAMLIREVAQQQEIMRELAEEIVALSKLVDGLNATIAGIEVEGGDGAQIADVEEAHLAKMPFDGNTVRRVNLELFVKRVLRIARQATAWQRQALSGVKAIRELDAEGWNLKKSA